MARREEYINRQNVSVYCLCVMMNDAVEARDNMDGVGGLKSVRNYNSFVLDIPDSK